MDWDKILKKTEEIRKLLNGKQDVEYDPYLWKYDNVGDWLDDIKKLDDSGLVAGFEAMSWSRANNSWKYSIRFNSEHWIII